MRGGKREGAGRKLGSKVGVVQIADMSAVGALVMACPVPKQDEITKGKTKNIYLKKNPANLKVSEYVKTAMVACVFENSFITEDVRKEFLAPIQPLIDYIKGNEIKPQQADLPETNIDIETPTKKSLSPQSKEILEKYPYLLSGRENK
jgi:hypothetical protein